MSRSSSRTRSQTRRAERGTTSHLHSRFRALPDNQHNKRTPVAQSRESAVAKRSSQRSIIIDNDAHTNVRRRASVAHELGHHLLEHAIDATLMGGDHARLFDPTKEKEATFMAGELLVPDAAAFKAAYAKWTNAQIAHAYGVSEQFAQMQMKGPRVVAARATKKYRGT